MGTSSLRADNPHATLFRVVCESDAQDVCERESSALGVSLLPGRLIRGWKHDGDRKLAFGALKVK